MAARPPTEPGIVGLSGDNPSPLLDGGRKIEASARAALQHSSYSELGRIACEYHEGILTLRGRVSSFYMKQIAQSTVQQVVGVERVVNRVEVVRSPYLR